MSRNVYGIVGPRAKLRFLRVGLMITRTFQFGVLCEVSCAGSYANVPIPARRDGLQFMYLPYHRIRRDLLILPIHGLRRYPNHFLKGLLRSRLRAVM